MLVYAVRKVLAPVLPAQSHLFLHSAVPFTPVVVIIPASKEPIVRNPPLCTHNTSC